MNGMLTALYVKRGGKTGARRNSGHSFYRKKFTYLLALDPGGTKCDTLLVAPDGTLLAHCRLRDREMGGRHPLVMRRTIEQVLTGFKPAPLRVAGLGKKKSLLCLPKRWQKHAHICQYSEAMAALATIGHSYGMVVIAGTGATVSLRTPKIAEAWLDGLGPVLGDSGSGYYIGREALRSLSIEMQLGRPPTRLCKRVLRACGCRMLHELIAFSLQPRDRSRIASLSTIVDEEARAGDPLAQQLLRDGARMLAATVRKLVDRLGIAKQQFPIVGAGSVAAQSDIYWQELCRQLRSIAPRFQPVRIPLPPVAGLAALGLRDTAATEKLFTTLKKELKT